MSRLATGLADRYRVERELGQGGMATVYLAEDLKHRRNVAIKVLHPDLGAALGAERFLSEISTTARLQHPHILPLLDSGEADGLLYYVMPLVTGETLRSRLERERQLPVQDAVRIAREVADALGCAHAQGVIHRDIKPENILLQGGHALVADFGIALAVQEAGGQRLTQTGLSLGTPQYMSPEQAMGEKQVDRRSDIYALGAVTYEMLIGEAPFTGPTVQSIVARIMTEEPRHLGVQRKAVPGPVEHAVLRALEKLPADRWASAEAFAAALEEQPGPAPRASAPRAIAPAPRVRLVIGVAILALGLLAAAWYVSRAPGNPSAKPRIVVLPAVNLAGAEQAYLADGIAEEINNRLVGLTGVEVIGRTSAERYRGTQLTPRQIGAELDANFILALRIGMEGPADGQRIRVSAELLNAANETQVWGKTYQARATADNFAMQGEIATQVAEEMGVTLISGDSARVAERPTENQEAYDDYLRATGILREKSSITQFFDAARYLQRAVDRDPGFAQAWAALGYAHAEIYWFWGDHSAARQELARAAGERARALAPNAAETHFALGVIAYHGHLDFPRALEHLNAAIAAKPGQARFLEFVAYVQRRSGDLEAALANARRALALDPRNVRILGDAMGQTLVYLGHSAEALRSAARATDLDPEDWQPHHTLMLAHTQMGDLAGAEAAARATMVRPGVQGFLVDRPRDLAWVIGRLPLEEQVTLAHTYPPLSPEISDTAMYFLVHAEILSSAGLDGRVKYERAAEHIERLIASQPNEGWYYDRLGTAYRGLGRVDEAIRAGRRAVELLAPLDRFEGPEVSLNLAQSYLAAGDQGQAAALARAFIRSLPGNRLLLKHDPQYAALRDLPQVRELLR